MLTTRIGKNSKMVITGDVKQKDRVINESGLNDFIRKYNKFEKKNVKDIGIRLVELNNSDIEREEIIKTILDIYNIEEDNECMNITKGVNESVVCRLEKDVNESVDSRLENGGNGGNGGNGVKVEKDVNDCALIPIELMLKSRKK